MTCACKAAYEAAAKVCYETYDSLTNPVRYSAVLDFAGRIRALPLCGKCESEPKAVQHSRSQLRRVAQQKGEPMPEFNAAPQDASIRKGEDGIVDTDSRKVESVTSPVATPAGAAPATVVTKWRKKPVLIEAVNWTGDNLREIISFTGWHQSASSKWSWEEYERVVATNGLKIFTLEGSHMATIGDWIIRGVKGEFYPCKPDIFSATYEPSASAAPAAPFAGWTGWIVTGPKGGTYHFSTADGWSVEQVVGPETKAAAVEGMPEEPFPHVPAAFISAIASGSTKAEAVRWLQRTWNEVCAIRAHAKRLQAENALLKAAVRDVQLIENIEQHLAAIAIAGKP